ncbi:FG-GAP-like repeat-containing protein [Paenibacillus sp. J5C_2022]|uniref:FG-GAP-like repeat-containing protein n=1 Tax=Paenibacillus sp. J5C2022 TaxID=2977129 RepID=UPI0021CF942F|nr:FG-GAP-like repeat-containing protein [Paenibacillus sp. J5C2022]MCU6710389.1 FG-GAP-like repeat-containing protein [Paenibacillus sp. J5C2022]
MSVRIGKYAKWMLSAAMAGLLMVGNGNGTVNDAAAVANAPQIGIWYSTWYAKEGSYFWAQSLGAGSSNQLVGDVSGDGKSDAVTFDNSSGGWYAALSDGDGFGSPSAWIAGHGTGSHAQFLADVNGDGKDDAIVYFQQDGSWWAALSNGSGFNAYSRWTVGHGAGSSQQLMADVNGDGKDDAVVYFEQTGEWWVSLSNGSSFSGMSRWITGHGSGSHSRLLADVNGDGKDDAIVYFGDTGEWWAALSNGSGFSAYTQWSSGFGAGAEAVFAGDVNGDGKADAVVYQEDSSPAGNWYKAESTGGSFTPSGTVWKYRHGAGSSRQWLADIYGSGMEAPVAFAGATGLWKAMPADDYYFKPNLLNTWEGGLLPNSRPIKYLPRTGGSYNTYDSGDPAVIDEHLAMLAAAGIDFLLLDETNGINVDNGYIKERAVALAQRIAVWNSDPANRKIRYAIAIGAMQTSHQPATMEGESAIVWNEFANHPVYGGDHYYHLNGKPLIVSYAEYTDRVQWEQWTGDKSASDAFTVRWIQGKVPWEAGSAYENTPPASDYGLYMGWSYPQGSLPNSDVMVVMPGQNNNVGYTISRTYNGVRGGFYSQLGWDRVLQEDPGIVVINSFNEFAEETAIQPADTSQLDAPSEKWLNAQGALDADMYWDMTVQYINSWLTSSP